MNNKTYFELRRYLLKIQLEINDCLRTLESSDGEELHESKDLVNLGTKVAKLKYLLAQEESMSAKEIRKKVKSVFGKELPNVDQSLVNLERDGVISHIKGPDGRKRYYLLEEPEK